MGGGPGANLKCDIAFLRKFYKLQTGNYINLLDNKRKEIVCLREHKLDQTDQHSWLRKQTFKSCAAVELQNVPIHFQWDQLWFDSREFSLK